MGSGDASVVDDDDAAAAAALAAASDVGFAAVGLGAGLPLVAGAVGLVAVVVVAGVVVGSDCCDENLQVASDGEYNAC